jgi:hypothetical protein
MRRTVYRVARHSTSSAATRPASGFADWAAVIPLRGNVRCRTYKPWSFAQQNSRSTTATRLCDPFGGGNAVYPSTEFCAAKLHYQTAQRFVTPSRATIAAAHVPHAKLEKKYMRKFPE